MEMAEHQPEQVLHATHEEEGEQDVRRFKVMVSFDGTDFHGWQRQPGVEPTLQGIIEDRIRVFFGAIQPPISIVVNGRTDAGVHARAAVFHMDVPRQEKTGRDPTRDPRCGCAALTPQLLLGALRNLMRGDVVIHSVEVAP